MIYNERGNNKIIMPAKGVNIPAIIDERALLGNEMTISIRISMFPFNTIVFSNYVSQGFI